MAVKKNLMEESIPRALFILGAPTIITGFLQSTFNLVDMFFVGRLGPAALAAVSACGVVIFLLITVAIGISIGTLAVVSRLWGEGHYRSAGLVLGQSLYLSLVVSVFFSLGGWYAARPLLSLLGARGDVLEMAVSYFRIISLGSVSIFITVCLSSALRGSGNATTPLKVMLVAVVLNIVLDPILIFGWFGLPALGIPGSALSTVISRTASMLILVTLIVGKRYHFDLSGAFRTVRWALIWQISKIGFFSSLEMLIQSASALLFLKIVAPFGTPALAAYGIGVRMRMMVMMPGIGLGYASGILVGQNLGAGSPGKARRSSWAAWLVYEILIFPVVAFLFFFPEVAVGFFNKNPEVLSVGREFVRYTALSLIFLALTVVLGKSLNGAGDTRGPMVITAFCSFFLALPLAYAGSRIWGIEWVWLAILFSSVVQGLLIVAWFEQGKWMEHAKPAFEAAL